MNEFKHVTLKSVKSKEALKDYVNRLTSDKNDITARKSIKEMKENYGVLIGKLSKTLLEKAFNPMKLEGEAVDIPSENEVISIINPSINALIGEELARNFEYRAYLINPTDISQKEVAVKEELSKKIASLVKNTSLSPEGIKLEMEKLKRWKTYSAQDIREQVANHIITDLKGRLSLKTVFKEGWKDVIAVNEEMYHIGLYNGNVLVERIDPTELSIYQLGNSSRIEEAGTLVWTRYMQPNIIVERYYDVLSKNDVKYIMGDIENKQPDNTSSTSVDIIADEGFITNKESEFYVDENDNEVYTQGNGIEKQNGNLRVSTIYVRTVRPVKMVTSIDTNGDEILEIKDKEYECLDNEESEVRYINEWYEATEIGDGVWVNIRPCPVQAADINNLAVNKPPIVGYIYKYGSIKKQSIVDVLKPIQHEWAIYSKKLSHLWARNLGKLVRIDVSKIPSNISNDVFFNWIKTYGVILENPYEESNKTGMAAGNSSVGAVDVDLSSSIQGVMHQMSYLQQLADDTIGINRQRRGELMASDGKGVTQEAVARSNKMTEEFFYEHDNVKARVLQLVLEYAKLGIVNGTDIRSQYVLDDMSTVVYTTEGSGFEESSYGVMVSNSRKQQELDNIFQQLAHAAMQNGTITISQIMSLYSIDSLAEKINTLKTSEEENRLRQEEEQKKARDLQQQMQQAELKDKQATREHEIAIANIKAQAQIQVAMINAERQMMSDSERANISAEKASTDAAHKQATLQQRQQENADRVKAESARLAVSRNNKQNKPR